MLYVIIAVEDENGIAAKELAQSSFCSSKGKYKVYYRGYIRYTSKLNDIERITIFVNDNFYKCNVSYSGFYKEKLTPNIRDFSFSIINQAELKNLCNRFLMSLTESEIISTVEIMMGDFLR